tara:strand:- start:2859 stop:3362 length:504 start_codon:yes stop_codon:yes gene_type:complete
MSKKARVLVMEGYVEYARVFKENMDSNPDFHPTGQFNMNFYPKTEEDLELFWEAGVEKAFRGNSRLKDPRSGDGYGIGQYIRLKRDNVNPVAEALGGAPHVVNWLGDADALSKGAGWAFSDGELGNGTEVRVKVTVYGEGDRTGHRLDKIGVVNLVEYASTLTADGF